jgi:hypothetical protein
LDEAAREDQAEAVPGVQGDVPAQPPQPEVLHESLHGDGEEEGGAGQEASGWAEANVDQHAAFRDK